MPTPIVLLTPEQVASHISEGSYKWDKGARCGEWLVLIGPDSNRKTYDKQYEYGYKEYGGIDRGGLWFDYNKLVDEDGHEDVVDTHNDYTYDKHGQAIKCSRSVTLKTVGRMLKALGMDVASYLE